eukprot:12977363-Ditylum_brightwellii.AAC.1
MPVQVAGRHCGTHILFWMLQILRHFTAENINTTEIREFILRLAFVTAASEDRKKTKEAIKKRRQL